MLGTMVPQLTSPFGATRVVTVSDDNRRTIRSDTAADVSPKWSDGLSSLPRPAREGLRDPVSGSL